MSPLVNGCQGNFMSKWIIFFRLCFMALMATFLTACYPKNPAADPAAGIIPPPGNYCQSQQQDCQRAIMISALMAKNVLVMKEGEVITMMLPSYEMFYPKTYHLTPSGRKLLNQVAALTSTFMTQRIMVTGYSTIGSMPKWDDVFSAKQAKCVADYLWGKGLDARMIVAQGKGRQQRISNPATALGRQQGQRIAIRFKFISALSQRLS